MISLYASGCTTDKEIDSGNMVTYSVPIHKGYDLSHCMLYLDLAAWDLVECLMKILTKHDYSFTASVNWENMQDFRKLCSVMLEFKEEKAIAAFSSSLQTYELTSGQVITTGNELFTALRLLFQPSFLA